LYALVVRRWNLLGFGSSSPARHHLPRPEAREHFARFAG
jgi:hypothetical protein